MKCADFPAARRLACAAVVAVTALSAGVANAVDVVGLNLGDVNQGLISGEYSSADLVAAYQARIAEFEPSYNAFIGLNPNALEEAKAIDAQRAIVGQTNPLFGVPVVIKNAFDVKGVPTTGGSALFSTAHGGLDLVPTNDAPVVARLRAAGAIIMGYTNLPDFSASYNTLSSVDGQTYNTYKRDILPGGSSGGTATAISASFAVVGMAEETAGSIQVPATAQSLVGIKPTFGLVPNTGITPLAGSTRDVAGPHSRDVYGAAAVLDTIAGYTPDDPKTAASNGHIPETGYAAGLSADALNGKRLGLFGVGFKNVALTAETSAMYQKALDTIVAKGATTVADPFAGSEYSATMGTPYAGFAGFESFLSDYQKYLNHLGPDSAASSFEEYKEVTGQDLLTKGLFPTLAALAGTTDPNATPDLTAFNELKAKALAIFNKIMDDNDLDALVFPEAYDKVPALDTGGQFYPATAISDVNILGLPGVTVPAGYYEDGTPFGLFFIGRQWSEKELIDDAYAFEQATHARIEPTLTAVPLPPAVLMFTPVALIGGYVSRRWRRPVEV